MEMVAMGCYIDTVYTVYMCTIVYMPGKLTLIMFSLSAEQ